MQSENLNSISLLDQSDNYSERQEHEMTKEQALDRLFAASGNFGKFQFFSFFTFQSAISCYSFWFYGMGFMIQEPAYKCTFTDPTQITDPDSVCTAENICDGNPLIASWNIDYSSADSLDNWQEKLDMMCKPKWLASSLGSIYFIGFVLTLVWLPRLADVYGRKVLFTYGVLAQAFLYTILMFTRDFYVMLLTIFTFGLLASIRQVTGFIYFLELMP